MLKILVVEEHVLDREGLLAALKSLADKTETIGAGDANAATAVLEQQDIDLMLLDLMLPGTRGQTFLPVVRRRFPTVPVVVLSALDDVDTVSKVMSAGASGFISKAASSTELLEGLRSVLDGNIYLPPKLRDAVSRTGTVQTGTKPLAQRFGLTAAQSRVLELLTEGRSNRQIAEVLGLTEGTVKIHVSAIMKTMGVTNRAEAALLATRKKRV